MARTLSLIVRNLLFTIVVPGLGGAWVPWWILTRHGGAALPAAWEAVPVIAAGAALYAWCVWNFAAVGRGTPGLWDAATAGDDAPQEHETGIETGRAPFGIAAGAGGADGFPERI